METYVVCNMITGRFTIYTNITISELKNRLCIGMSTEAQYQIIGPRIIAKGSTMVSFDGEWF